MANMLGIPKEKGGIKKLFIAPPGFRMMEADGSQMEVRVLGALSNDRQMIEDFRNGVDFHGAGRHRLYGRGFDKKNYTHQEVLDAKTGIFGPIYGRGADSMAKLFKCSVVAAQKIIDALWEPYPTALAFLQSKEQEVLDEGELISYYGRYRRWPLITPDNKLDVMHEGRNFPVSSPSSDTNLLIMLETYRNYPHDVVLPLLPVHDSILCRVREKDAEDLAIEFGRFCEKRAAELLNTDMKFEYEATLGTSWGDQKEVHLN